MRGKRRILSVLWRRNSRWARTWRARNPRAWPIGELSPTKSGLERETFAFISGARSARLDSTRLDSTRPLVYLAKKIARSHKSSDKAEERRGEERQGRKEGLFARAWRAKGNLWASKGSRRTPRCRPRSTPRHCSTAAGPMRRDATQSEPFSAAGADLALVHARTDTHVCGGRAGEREVGIAADGPISSGHHGGDTDGVRRGHAKVFPRCRLSAVEGPAEREHLIFARARACVWRVTRDWRGRPRPSRLDSGAIG